MLCIYLLFHILDTILLSESIYPSGNEIDRDINAAINIRDFAIHKSIVKNILNTDGTSGINACGVGSSGNRSVNCVCETADSETRMFSHLTRENRNHLQ